MTLSQLDPVAKRRINALKRKTHRLAKLLHDKEAHPDFVNYQHAGDANTARALNREGLKKVGEFICQGVVMRTYARPVPRDMTHFWASEELAVQADYDRLVRQAHYCECLPGYQYALAGWSTTGEHRTTAGKDLRTIKGPVVYWPATGGWAYNHVEPERINSRGTPLMIAPDLLMFSLVRPTPEGEADGTFDTEPVSLAELKHFSDKARLVVVPLDADPFDTVHFRPAHEVMLQGDYPVSEASRGHIRSLLYGKRHWVIEHGLLLLRLPNP